MMPFRIYDTAAREKVDFQPLVEGQISIYVCGLTVYDLPHIGHARTFVVFDVLRRFLIELGYDVKFVRNHTDIDDKIINRAREEGITPEALADKMIGALHEDMASIDVAQADVEPRVTQHIPDIIAFIEKLIANGHAYAADGDVYFSVSSFADYGKLSNRKLEDMLVNVRIGVNESKKESADFALWKGCATPDDMGWDSPWGKGRPGWHIECSCMSTKYLTPSFDIHGGGRDLIFPHHENEIAQAKGAQDGAFARYWMHVGMVEINGEKMSHSLKNFWTLRDIAKQVHSEALRYFFLTTHHRQNINFSETIIAEASQRISAIYRTLEAADAAIAAFVTKNPNTQRDEAVYEAYVSEFLSAMLDDMNTPKALASIAQATTKANEIIDAKGKKKLEQMSQLMACTEALRRMGRYVGLFTRSPEQALTELRDRAVVRLKLDVDAIESLMLERVKAREGKNWEASDEIRTKLEAIGVQVLDRPGGSIWQVS